jgi:hypothetical protein
MMDVTETPLTSAAHRRGTDAQTARQTNTKENQQ